MPRQSKTPRVAESYRAFRRNNWRGKVWPGTRKARVVPFLCKPPIFKFNWANLLLPVRKSPLVSVKERKQPKVYRAGIDAKRRAADWDAWKRRLEQCTLTFGEGTHVCTATVPA